VQNYLQLEAIEQLPWPAMSSDMNPVEHLSSVKNTCTTKARLIWLENEN
jgi:hypothetical protein